MDGNHTKITVPETGVTKLAAQHSVQPTSGIRRVFRQFSAPQQDSVFEPCPRPAHLRLTQAVGRLA